MKPYLSVIIPAYNEEKRIGKTLVAVYEYLSKQAYAWELLIVLDGVTDNTLSVVEGFSAGKAHIRWVDRKENRGKGYTVREGMLMAKGAVRLFADADNSTDIAHFDKMKPLFAQGYDVVIASRDSKDAEGAQQAIAQPFLKRFLGNAGNLVIQVLAVPGIWDTQCGFKAFTETAAGKIFTTAQIERWAFDMETLAIAQRNRYKIGIVPAYWVNDEDTHVTSWNYVESLWEAVKLRVRLLRGVYG